MVLSRLLPVSKEDLTKARQPPWRVQNGSPGVPEHFPSAGAPPASPPRPVPALTISMILVFLPVFLFMVNRYWASTTPATRPHTLALATAPTRTTAALSMNREPRDPPERKRPGHRAPRGASLATGLDALREPRPRGEPHPPERRGWGPGKGGGAWPACGGA